MPWNDDSKHGPWSSPGDAKGDRPPLSGERSGGEEEGRRAGPWDARPRTDAPSGGEKPGRGPWSDLPSEPAKPGGPRRPEFRKPFVGGPGARKPKPEAKDTRNPDPRSPDRGSPDRPRRRLPTPHLPFKLPKRRTGQARPSLKAPQPSPGPNLEALQRQVRAGLMRGLGAKTPRALRVRLSLAIAGLALAGWALSGIYVVQPDEQAVTTRLGAYVGEGGPGLGYHLPAPIERVQRVSVTRANRLEIGDTPDSAPADGLTPTRDGNLVDVGFTVEWRATDARKYLFRVADPAAAVKATAESAMRQVIAQAPLAAAMGAGRTQLQADALRQTQRVLNSYGLGVKVMSLQIRSVSPPPEVTPAFRDIAAAHQEAAVAVDEADAYRTRVTGEAKGDADKVVQDAQGYGEQITREAQGEAAHFNAIEAQYRQSPVLTRQRLYLETMQQVLAHAKKLVLDLPKGGASIVLPPDLFRRAETGSVAAPPSNAQTNAASSASAPAPTAKPAPGGSDGGAGR